MLLLHIFSPRFFAGDARFVGAIFLVYLEMNTATAQGTRATEQGAHVM